MEIEKKEIIWKSFKLQYIGVKMIEMKISLQSLNDESKGS